MDKQVEFSIKLILAGDIGGTKTILMLTTCEEKPSIRAEQTFLSQNYASLEDVVEEFLKGREEPIEAACFGVAGPVIDGKCKASNLPWVVDATTLGKHFNIPNVTLLNDLEATACGIFVLKEEDFHILNVGEPQERGNAALIAAGTGLGEAIMFFDGKQIRVSASEGGHVDFAPRNPVEIEVLQYLLQRFKRVSYERVLSGPGLLNIYHFFRDKNGTKEPEWLAERMAQRDPSAVITEVALAGEDELCVNALDLFVSVYGAEAGNLALKAIATHGVYVGGGIAPKIFEKLCDGAFMEAFCNKGRLSSLMAKIPVRVILNEQTALLGTVWNAFLHLKKG